MTVLNFRRFIGGAVWLLVAFTLGCSSSTDSPDGSVTITLGSQTLVLTQGANGTVTVNVVRTDFDGTLTVSAQNLPSGVTAPAVSIAGGENQASLAFTASAGATAGQSNVTIRVAGSGIAAKTATLSLTVNANTTPTFTLAATANAVTAAPGGAATTTISANRTGAFTGEVSLSASAPAGITASLSQATLTASVTSSVLTITVGGSVSAGAYTVVVTAVSGTIVRTFDVALTVTGATGGFSLALGSPSATITAGAQGVATVTITRVGGFAGAVNLTATTPAGVTAAFNPASVTGTSSTMTLTVGGAVAPGVSTVTIRGNAAGLGEQTATLNLTVSSAGGGGNVTWNFCTSALGLPIFVAAQDGAGAWQQVTGANNVFSFQINSGRGGVAFAVPTSGGGWDTQVFYLTTAELEATGSGRCFGSPGAGKTVTGTLANAGLTDLAFATLGQTQAARVGGALTFSGVIAGNLDLVTANSTLDIGTGATTPTRFQIQRGLNIAANGSVGTIDVTTGVAPASASMTINNLGAELAMVGPVSYVTANNTFALLYTLGAIPSASTQQTWYGFPGASQVAGDVHVLNVISLPSLFDASQTRQVMLASSAVANRTVTLGPALNAPAVSVTGTAPYVRLNAAYTVQQSYNGYFVANYQQGTGAAERRVTVQASSGGIAGAATFNGQIPDFSALAGYPSDYGLKTAVQTTWTVTATGWTSGNFVVTNPWTDGATYFSATRIGMITP